MAKPIMNLNLSTKAGISISTYAYYYLFIMYVLFKLYIL